MSYLFGLDKPTISFESGLLSCVAWHNDRYKEKWDVKLMVDLVLPDIIADKAVAVGEHEPVMQCQ